VKRERERKKERKDNNIRKGRGREGYKVKK
jgi:hypothetical protein